MAEKTSPAAKMSTAQIRKIKKPIIERRRRERINESLNQLKSLVLEAMQKDESRYSKMEKADILEMTVKHLKIVHRQRLVVPEVVAPQQDLTVKYRAGFKECANEVSRYLSSMEGLGGDVRMRLTQHLGGIGQKPTAATTSVPAHIPCATPVSTLPGMTCYSPPSSMMAHKGAAPITMTVPAVAQPLQVAVPQMALPSLPAGVLVMSSPQGLVSPGLSMSPASSPSPSSPSPSSVLKSAIPLYVNTHLAQAGHSMPSVPIKEEPGRYMMPTVPIKTEGRCSQSPKEADMVPQYFDTINNTSSHTVLPSGPHMCRQKYICMDMYSAMGKNVWRPW